MTLRPLYSFSVLAILMAVFVVFGVAPAYAQDAKKPAAVTTHDRQRGGKILDSFIKEAEVFQGQCQQSPQYNMYYNCECLAEKFLKIRLAMPDKPQGAILYELNNLNNECIDATNISGFQYEQCSKNGPLLPSGRAADKYCQCYANTYGKLIEDFKGRLSSKAFVELQTQAYVTCSDPQLARRLYAFQ